MSQYAAKQGFLPAMKNFATTFFHHYNVHQLKFRHRYILSGAHDGKKGVGARNAHALMSFSVSYLFPADILFLEQQNGRFVAQILVTRLFLGLLYAIQVSKGCC